jgi:hypothetical protein
MWQQEFIWFFTLFHQELLSHKFSHLSEDVEA